MNNPRFFDLQQGSVLLEGLISIAIFSFGVLAVLGMQARGVQIVSETGDRSRAAALANSLISEMWLAPKYDSASLPPAPAPDADPGQIRLSTDYASMPSGSAYVVWFSKVQTSLPSATANVTITAGNLVDIEITWQAPNATRASKYNVRTVIN